MSFLEIVLLAVGLSMDSLAVSVTGGALIQNYRHHHMLKIGCVMGIFQAGMTIAGYLAGMSFKKYITDSITGSLSCCCFTSEAK